MFIGYDVFVGINVSQVMRLSFFSHLQQANLRNIHWKKPNFLEFFNILIQPLFEGSTYLELISSDS